MALQPVSGFTPYSRNNLNFNGRNNRQSDDSLQASRFSVPTGVKAIPIAVLIAMSPLNEVNAVGASMPEPALTEITDNTVKKKPDILSGYDILDKKSGNVYYRVNFIDLDKDRSTYEALEIIKLFDNEVYSRGLITAGFIGRDREGKPMMSLSGVALSKDDLTSYKPIPGLFTDLKKSDYNAGSLYELAAFLKHVATKDKDNNDAFVLYDSTLSKNSEKNSELRSYFNKNY